MNEREIKQRVRDAQIIEKARADAQSGRYEPPHDLGLGVDELLGPFLRSDEDIRQRKIYRIAWRAEKDR